MNFILENKRNIKKKIFGDRFESASLQDFDFDGEWSLLKRFFTKENDLSCGFESEMDECLQNVFYVEAPIGSGKTHLCAALFEEFCSPFGVGSPGCKYLKESELYRTASSCFSLNDLGEESEFSRLYNQKVILLDDVGSTWRSSDRKQVMINFLKNRSFQKTILFSSVIFSEFCIFLGIPSRWKTENIIMRLDSESLRQL